MKRGECIKCGHTWPENEPDNCPKCTPIPAKPKPKVHDLRKPRFSNSIADAFDKAKKK